MTTALVLDTETDSKTTPRVIQLAYINASTQESFNQFYNSGRKICPATMAVHHITDADVKDAPVFNASTLPAIDYMIGHNIDYDWQVIGSPNCKRICTLALVRSYFPEWAGHSLGASIYYILPAEEAKAMIKNAHDALVDVKANFVLYEYICKHIGVNPQDYETMWQKSEHARIPKTMPFGKHRGKVISDMPKSYISWAINNLTDIDPYLRKALEDVS